MGLHNHLLVWIFVGLIFNRKKDLRYTLIIWGIFSYQLFRIENLIVGFYWEYADSSDVVKNDESVIIKQAQ